jgi:hypothetical protein
MRTKRGGVRIPRRGRQRRLRLGDVALALAVAVLAAATVAHYHVLADEKARTSAARAAFARYVAGRPGTFDRGEVKHLRRVDVLCALHRPAPGRPADYSLCATVARGTRAIVALQRQSAAAARLARERAARLRQTGS